MKTTLRFLLVLAVSLQFCPGWTHAADDDQAARHTDAEALLNAMHTQQMLVNATTRVHGMVDKYGQQGMSAKTDLTPEQKVAMQKAQDDAHALINQQLGWDAVKTEFIAAYADAFTDDELKGLAAFYNSPLGQKLVEKQPAVTEKMGRLTQQKMMAVMPQVMQKIKEGQPKPAAAPSPTAAASPVIPAAPAAPAPAASPAP